MRTRPKASARGPPAAPPQPYQNPVQHPYHMAHAQPNAQIPPTESQKSRGIALICVLLFGALGVHEFYVGRVMAGLIMLALFIMFIASLIDLGLDPNLIFVFGIVMLSWIIVDLVKILLGLYKDRYGLRLKRWSF